MVRDEIDNKGEGMEIDGAEKAPKANYEIREGFNANYLKIYYGETFVCSLLFFPQRLEILCLSVFWF